MLESEIQAQVRLKASSLGWHLWRNNVGVLLDSRGVPIRYGLANDSKLVNRAVKSGDLVGIRPLLITADMVGRTMGQFVSVECKRKGWTYNPDDAHEAAQMRWAEMVMLAGGSALFTTGDLS